MNVFTRLSEFINAFVGGCARCLKTRFGLARPTSLATGAAVLSLLSVVIIALGPSTTFAADPSVWQMTPYRIQVLVAIAPRPSLPPRLQTQLCGSLAARIEAVIGAPWNANVSLAPPALRYVLLNDIENMQVDPEQLPMEETDKILFLAVQTDPGHATVTARDFDVPTRLLNPAVTLPVWQIGSLSDVAFDAMLAAFAPLARIDRTEKDQVVSRLKASGLPLRDRNLQMIHVDDVFRPILRYKDREGNFRRAVPVPWTFCTVTSILPGEIRAQVHSGIRATLTTRGRGRVESLAMRVVPQRGSTILVLRSRTEPKVPLAGYEVYSHPPGKKGAALVGRTDRQGRLLVPPGESLLRCLLIKNGTEPLARLLMVPGLEPQLTAEIPDDDARLEAEGFVTGLQEELVDLVARREILMAGVRARIEAGQINRAEKLFDELGRLPNASQFLESVARERERLASKDPAIQAKIDALLADTCHLIDRHLDSNGIEELERELRTAKGGNSK